MTGSATSALAVLACLLPGAFETVSGAPPPGTSLVFSPADAGQFSFDTGVLRGVLRAGGKSGGLSSVIYIPKNLRLDSSMGLLSHYRVFTTNKRYGTAAWDWPSQARLLPDGAVSVTWSAVPERPFKLEATYRWVAADTLDLDTRVTAGTRLEGFEAFLASYFAPSFTNAIVYAGSPDSGSFVHALQTAGTWQCFPRDSAAVALFNDGRWKIEPNPVQWQMMSKLAKPIGVRCSPAEGVTAAIYAPSADCFAVSTPYETESHYSMYLSLFGRDLVSGETLMARTRLVIRGNVLEDGILQGWKRFASE